MRLNVPAKHDVRLVSEQRHRDGARNAGRRIQPRGSCSSEVMHQLSGKTCSLRSFAPGFIERAVRNRPTVAMKQPCNPPPQFAFLQRNLRDLNANEVAQVSRQWPLVCSAIL